MIKKCLCDLLSSVLILSTLILSGCSEKKPTKITYLSAEKSALYDGELHCEDTLFSSFAAYSLKEAVNIIKATENCSDKKAKKLLASGGYTIETTFNRQITENVKSAFSNVITAVTPSAAAITDLNGAVLSIYSGGEEVDYASTPTYAGSVIKPLSVYAPLIDKGLASWSSVQVDTPVKKVAIGTTLSDWPQNADGKYSQTNVTLAKAVKSSTNTVAVKWLKVLGVTNSIDFLENSFGFNLSEERELIKDYSADEVLGNIALGYLRGGITPVEIAASYRIFSGDGKYITPYSIAKITDAKGSIIFDVEKNKPKAKQIISNETSAIMNRLLKTVLEPGGTGAEAAGNGINIVGKTGTTDNNDNWFAGLSPEYTCAVWYQNTAVENTKNKAPVVFSKIMQTITTDKNKNFSLSKNVIKQLYCEDSGLLLSDNCIKMKSGWFATDKLPKICNAH